MSKPIVAILYDFDATLATSDMQNFSFIPSLGLTPDEFWGKTKEFSEKTGCEKTLGYIYTMIAECKKRGIKMTRSFLREQGKGIKFWPGVDTWFERINKFGEENGVEVEHYLVSSGNKEIVEGCSIYKYFKMVYGCEFIFDENDEPIWPKLVINYTQKTQYFYRVSKGAFDINDDVGVNEKNRNRRVPYSNIVYIGDGLTDIPAMILAKITADIRSPSTQKAEKARSSMTFTMMAASTMLPLPITAKAKSLMRSCVLSSRAFPSTSLLSKEAI